MPLLLASASPQRAAILTQLGVPFRVHVPATLELEQGAPQTVAVENSRRKAAAVRDELRSGELLVAVDTIVVLPESGVVYGKPADRADAERMLRVLCGRSHTVLGGLTLLVDGARHSLCASTQVTFRQPGEAFLQRYLDGGEWRERAGGYAIQGTGATFVAGVEGDYFNVVGFPVAAFLDLLETLGLADRAFADR